jgi:hypothetical protein
MSAWIRNLFGFYVDFSVDFYTKFWIYKIHNLFNMLRLILNRFLVDENLCGFWGPFVDFLFRITATLMCDCVFVYVLR